MNKDKEDTILIFLKEKMSETNEYYSWLFITENNIKKKRDEKCLGICSSHITIYFPIEEKQNNKNQIKN